MKLLGVKPVRPPVPTLPKGYRFSLEKVNPVEVAHLLADAFGFDVTAWAPSPDAYAVVALFDPEDRLVGVCQVLTPCFLHQFAILPDQQMQGLGHKMFDWAVNTFNLPYVLVAVDETTTSAGHKFWMALGFTEVGS
jgi:hypothetical protein